MLHPLMSIPAALLTTFASANVLWDQIGSSTGESLTGDIYGSMHFLPEIPLTSDLAAVDAFTLEQHSAVDGVEFVLNGWSAFDGPADVTNWQVNIYSNLEAAASNLTGNILSQESMPIFVDEWSGDGWLIRLPISLAIDRGTYLVSVLMSNPYPDNGWVGVATSSIGDDQAWQVSPGGDYVFSPFIEAPDNLAYRLTGTSITVPSPAPIVAISIASLFVRTRRR